LGSIVPQVKFQKRHFTLIPLRFRFHSLGTDFDVQFLAFPTIASEFWPCTI
jgi:hypothetical protein